MIILADAIRNVVGDTDSEDFNSRGSRGIILYLDIDSVAGTAPTVNVKLQAKSPNGDYIDVPGVSFAQKTAAGTDSLVLYPGVAATANRSVSGILPRMFRVKTTLGGSASPNWDGSVTAHLLG